MIFTVGREMAEAGRDMISMGVVGALYPLGLMSSLVTGRLSDRFGRRRMILAGLCVSFAVPLLVLQRVYEVSYFLGGIAGGMVYPALVAILTQGSRGSGARSAMSHTLILFCVSWNAGLLSGQLAGGWLFSIDRIWPLAGCLLLNTVCVILALIGRREPAEQAAEQVITVDDDLRHRELAARFSRLARVANIGGAVSMSMVMHLFPKLAVAMQITADVHGLLLGAMRLLIITVYLLLHLTVFWHFRLSVMLICQAVAVAGLILLMLAQDVTTVTIGLLGIALLQGFNYFAGLYYSAAGSHEERRGTASGLHEATLSAGFCLGSLLGGIVGHHWGLRAPYGLAAAIIICLAVIQIVLATRARASTV